MEYNNETKVSSKMKGGVRNVQDSDRPFLLEAVAVVPEVVLGVHRPVVEHRVLPALDDLVPQHHLVHLFRRESDCSIYLTLSETTPFMTKSPHTICEEMTLLMTHTLFFGVEYSAER